MESYGKLVRDNVPQMLESQGNKCDVDTLQEEIVLEYLYIKLQEEIFDLVDTGDIDELADILEIVYSIGEKYGYSSEDLYKRKIEKKEEYGGFKKNILLKKIY